VWYAGLDVLSKPDGSHLNNVSNTDWRCRN